MNTIARSLPVSKIAREPSTLRGTIEGLLASADIRINGSRPWDMRIHRNGVLERIASHGSLGLGESYVEGDWDAENLDEFFTRVLRAKLDHETGSLRLVLPLLRDRVFNRQNRRRAWKVGTAHYDIGNDFYQAMLGPVMAYSCGYWDTAATLPEAQEAKLDLVCRKLRLQPGMRVLDIGCGWGAFMKHAATRYGSECVGITISKEQAAFARSHDDGLPLEFRLQDYRDLNERFDGIASIGMFEHVGRKNYRTYMKVVHRCLADDGIFVLHSIGRNDRHGSIDPWIEKHIFPNGELPALGHIGDAIDGLFVTEDVHNIGAHYDRTLMEWHANFESAWPRFADRLDDRFRRQWKYYLLACAGAFRARDLQVWQWTFSKHGVPGGCPRVA